MDFQGGPQKGDPRADSTFRTVCSALLFLSLFLLTAGPAFADGNIQGRPRVLSGDQLRIGKTEVHLFGLDAPEMDQYCENEYGRPYRCGVMALDELKRMVGPNTISCVPEGVDDQNRVLAVCYVGDMNINSRMVRTGWAVARPAQRPDYAQLESLAKRDKTGIWEFIFQDPELWRSENAPN
ncbi:MAG: thermonuclease family protein [Alphaproteobacteria bacterium]|nr:thermonuclease family protein [Alphaproteobacteria bacterium]